jgi:hypothetical protein
LQPTRGPSAARTGRRRQAPRGRKLFRTGPVSVILVREVTMPTRFPSLAFFETLQRTMRAEGERFSRLGFFDTTFGVRVLGDDGAPPAEFVLTFEVFDCTGVAEGPPPADVDFVLEGSLAAWAGMLDNIHALGAADTAHSINTLTHFGEGLRLVYDDPDGRDKLYRFAESVQVFFDLTAQLDFAYPDGRRPPARRDALQRSGT